MIPTANFDKAEEVRTFEKGEMQVVTVDGRTVGRAVFRPGWKWSTCVKPIAGTDSCQSAHFGVIVSGHLMTRLDSGEEASAGPGDVVAIPPGHDGWVIGDEDVVFIEMAAAVSYAKPTS